MDIQKKLEILSASAKYDICTSPLCGLLSSRRIARLGNLFSQAIYYSQLPNGRLVPLFKILLSNACEKDCFYCVNRRGRDFPRTTFDPEELARLFFELYKGNYVEGLFLSSAIVDNANQTMERMLKTVEILRQKMGFSGYIHLKILPGCGQDLIERASLLVDRASVNLEMPNPQKLALIAKSKDFKADLLQPLEWLKSYASQGRFSAGLTTQFVVGAAGETDQEILKTSAWLYSKMGLKRIYFSAFQPITNTPLEVHEPTSPIREHRLYQADWLLRFYGFRVEELVFDEGKNLPPKLDPKMVWALNHPENFPLEVNRASYEDLLRVPGIGPLSARRIVKIRKEGQIKELKSLKGMGVVTKRAAPFITLEGKIPLSEEKPKRKDERQILLWGSFESLSASLGDKA